MWALSSASAGPVTTQTNLIVLHIKNRLMLQFSRTVVLGASKLGDLLKVRTSAKAHHAVSQ